MRASHAPVYLFSAVWLASATACTVRASDTEQSDQAIEQSKKIEDEAGAVDLSDLPAGCSDLYSSLEGYEFADGPSSGVSPWRNTQVTLKIGEKQWQIRNLAGRDYKMPALGNSVQCKGSGSKFSTLPEYCSVTIKFSNLSCECDKDKCSPAC